MFYTIRVYYSTGDSFGNWEEQSTVGHAWEKRELAELVSTYIDEHDEAYRKYQTMRTPADQARFVERIKDKPWFHDHWESSLLVPTDNGYITTIDAFWVGWFETYTMSEVEEEAP